jgi:starch synthase (maltosyl-transferring)
LTREHRRNQLVLSASRPQRVVINHVEPQIEGGRFPIKRVVGDEVLVSADIFADGHDVLRAVLRSRHAEEPLWHEAPMKELGNDRWRGSFRVTKVGRYQYTLQAWVDRFATWRRDFEKRLEACQDVTLDLMAGIALVEEASQRAWGADAEKLEQWARRLEESPLGDLRAALSEELAELMANCSDRRSATTCDNQLEVTVDPESARSSAWYEMFPRSASDSPGRHGTFRDCEERLAYVASMGFDVLYLPPIHPVGITYRKGKNGAPLARPSDPGSVWAIGSSEGGHKAIHPELGTLEDFKRLLAKAREYGIEVALDLAYQCSPDHPYVTEHPEWFRHRPDGTIQYAENPPKKYQDIYPLDFETSHAQELWEELKSIVDYWIDQGVRIFRVDNPHTKPFAFWEWMIGEVKQQHPEVIFLSEAFTRPKIMYRLAKLGFTHSYTYFTWRNTKQELTEYFTELTQTEVREYFRPHVWPNTPDILPEGLQTGGRPAFMSRLVLATTLAANYGIYGPAFELCENRALVPGREDYLDAEKYEIRGWDIARPDSLAGLIARLNRIRRDNPALRRDASLRFQHLDNEQLIAYTKATDDLSNVILVIVNLDPRHTQSGWVTLPPEEWGLDPRQAYEVHDLLAEARYAWQGPRNYVELDPSKLPAHVFRLR